MGIEDTKARLKRLEEFKAAELKLAKPSRVYLDDLELSIAFCRHEIASYGKPLEIVNGVV